MSFYISKTIEASFDDAIDRVTKSLADQGFGILTDIDVKAVMKKKLDVDYRPYRILGACNPTFAHQALSISSLIGTMLPCSVIVQEMESGEIEVAVIDPAAAMSVVDNPELDALSKEVREKLVLAIENI